MIVLQEMTWSNCFSYGENNYIDFSKNNITQVLGENGHGKSSIVLILQEVLYGKNSKGIKKSDILNRNSKDGRYTVNLKLQIDGVDYSIQHSRRGNSIELSLFKGREEISEHTTTNTYKKIEKLLGLSFEDFCQLVYQSSDSSLELLRTTDTNRKKFLISLLSLEHYTSLEEKIKKILQSVSTQCVELDSKCKTISSWLNKVSKESLEYTELQEIPPDPENLREEIAKLKAQQSNISDLQTKISANNKAKNRYTQLKATLQTMPSSTLYDKEALISKKATIEQKIATVKEQEKEYKNTKESCPTCKRKFDNVDVNLIQSMIENCKNTLSILNLELKEVTEEIAECKVQQEKLATWQKLKDEFDRLSIDDSLPDSIDEDLSGLIKSMQTELSQKLKAIEAVKEYNTEATKRNAKIDNIKEQLVDYTAQKAETEETLKAHKAREARLEVLKQAFSTRGLVAYKIESMIKDLEAMVNDYLLEFSSGRFSLEFTVSNDKLNVGLTDNGKDISITALSSGELARVNTSTLLAIRKLLNTLSNNRLNLLFLDEVLNVLDEDGRQKLISILNEEQELNSFIVSHGWYHPLVARVRVVKDHGISHIKED